METRIEKDSMGEMKVPANAYYGAQTQRAVENFPVSGIRFPRGFVAALGLLKRACAEVNLEMGLLDEKTAKAIIEAEKEVIEGKLDDHFVLDVFQTGSGTSSNMNANEVIANRAIEILGGEIGSKTVHPNDHVNKSQSSNDMIPSACHVAARREIQSDLLPALEELRDSLGRKEKEFDDIIKVGRTHLMDATPVRLGQVFGGYRSQLDHGIERVKQSMAGLEELALGGTAVGTGLNAKPGFAAKVCEKVAQWTELPFREAENHFEAQAGRDALAAASASIRSVALSLMKIANDIRFLGSGPRCGIGELKLPSLQPGSSIMPGKVNPVIPEVVSQVVAQVMGNDLAVSVGAQGGHFELNVMIPVMIHNLLESTKITASACRLLASRCVDGLEADKERCETLVEQSLSLVTPLAPHIGYDKAAELAKKAHATGKTAREVAKEMGVITPELEEKVFNLRKLTEPGIPG